MAHLNLARFIGFQTGTGRLEGTVNGLGEPRLLASGGDCLFPSRGIMNQAGRGPMVKEIRKYDSHEEAEEADRKFYLNLTPDERVNILLDIIRPEVEAHYAAGKGFARVCRVTDLASS